MLLRIVIRHLSHRCEHTIRTITDFKYNDTSCSIIIVSSISFKKVTIETTFGEQDNNTDSNCTERCPFEIINTQKNFKNSDESNNLTA